RISSFRGLASRSGALLPRGRRGLGEEGRLAGQQMVIEHFRRPVQTRCMMHPAIYRMLPVFAVLSAALAAHGAEILEGQAKAPSHYEHREQHSPDGIGKFYLGREIAHVMGHQAADWLERPTREEEE